MNEQDRLECQRLKARQARLERELLQLSAEVSAFQQRMALNSPEPQADEAGPGVEGVVNVAETAMAQPLEVPPVIPQSAPPAATPVRPVSVPRSYRAWEPIGIAPTRTESDTPAPLAQQDQGATSEPAGPATAVVEQAVKEASLEMRVGKYWLVRVGIVMVLTSLVFFGNLAYQTMGAPGRVALLYLASAVLLGAGTWWQRKAVKDSLSNYAQVLFAGGLAAVYFTTYAAHHFESLRVIPSAQLDGLLLLIWAGFMSWVADRKKSELLGIFSVGLAYYTCVITRVGSFTLYSNLVLTVAAVFFLVRNRWAVLSFGSLIATYAAYAFWRFFRQGWHWASPEDGLWTGMYFLMSYWVVFTGAVFLSRDRQFAGQQRAAFLTVNNGFFFTFFVLTMLQVEQGGFWKFSLIYGAVLLGLAEAARRVFAEEPLARQFYLTQGLLLVTVGLIAKYSGLNLALILGAESVVLHLLARARGNLVLKVGAFLTAALAVGWGIDGVREMDHAGLWLSAGLGVLMLVNTLVADRETRSRSEPIRLGPAFFTVLTLVAWLVATWNNTAHPDFPLVLGAEGLLLTWSFYLLRVREVTLLSQGYLVLAQFAWVVYWVGNVGVLPWWNPVALIALTMAASHWWQRQKVLLLEGQASQFWQWLYGLALTGILYFWLERTVALPAWMALAGGLALGLTAYGVVTRLWAVAGCGQLLLLASGWLFVTQLADTKPAWHFPLVPIAVLVILSLATVKWFEAWPGRVEVRRPLLQLACVYRWVALAMGIWWVCKYVPAKERVWILMALGTVVVAIGGWRKNRESLLFAAALSAASLAFFWFPFPGAVAVYWANLVAIGLLLAEEQVVRGLVSRFGAIDSRVHAAVVVVGGVSLWWFVSRRVLQSASGFYLTVSWSVLALGLFTAGIALRDRIYRWLGLGVLACALGRVIVFDVWKLERLPRILSFLALGVVLLVLGYIYNKYQEKIKEWL